MKREREKDDPGTRLRVLLVSDTHTNLKYVNSLGSLLIERGEVVDLVLLSGDIADVPMAQQAQQEQPERSRAYEGDMSAVISGLENFCARVVYVPGNHDPRTVFVSPSEVAPRLTPHSINVHGKCLRVAPGLVVVGAGGSVPGTRSGTSVWAGFPFTSDAEFAAMLPDLVAVSSAEAIEAAGEDGNVICPDDMLLVMTHVGPRDASTSVDAAELDKQPILGGSEALGQVLRHASLQQRVVANVHGHTHAGVGVTSVGAIPVINPGALTLGRFALLTLQRSAFSRRWYVAETQLVQLD